MEGGGDALRIEGVGPSRGRGSRSGPMAGRPVEVRLWGSQCSRR